MSHSWRYENWREYVRKAAGREMVLATHPDTQNVFRWQDGVYENLTANWHRTLLEENVSTLSKGAGVELLHEVTHSSPWLTGDRHSLDSTDPWTNFANGVYKVATGEFVGHGEPWFSTNQIPHDYRADLSDEELQAATAGMDAYLSERVAPDVYEAGVLWQVIGSAMLPGNPGQNFVVLQGPGGSGKGTFLSILAGVLGSENTAYLTPAQMRSNFRAADLQGTLANIAGDVVGGEVPAYELILGITGGDPISGDRKYREPITFTWDGLLIMATNGRLTLPSGAGGESGWWRRALYIDFPNAVASQERVGPKELMGRICPDPALVATRAARELSKSYQLGKAVQEVPSMARSRTAARISGDSVEAWVLDRTTPDRDHRLDGKVAYTDYRLWCFTYGVSPKGVNRFYEAMESVLTRNGWGQRGPRSKTSKATFDGLYLNLAPHLLI